LNESPFSLAPDPRFLFASASHSAALAQVAQALERREPLVVITGEIGTGKTLLCRTVLQRLPFKTFLSVINDPLLEADDLVKELLKDFGVISKEPARFRGASRHELVQTLHAFLSSLTPIQAHAVVMIDEAQHLRPDVLEQIRLLSNIDDTRGTILQIILVGQKDLESLLSRPELRQLQQRVSRRFALEPLSRDEVQQYISHRLALAGRAETPSRETAPGVEFTPVAIQAVAEISAGVPRVINLLCDRSLELGSQLRMRTIDGVLIRAAGGALGIERPVERPEGSEGSELLQQVSAPIVSGAADRPAESPFARYLTIGALAAVIVAAVAFGIMRFQAPAADAPRPPVETQAPPAATDSKGPPASAVAVPPKNAAPAPAPERGRASGPASSSARPAPPASAASAGAAAPDDTRFEIVVASFRTEARAISVVEEVTALGLPAHRRASDAWQQVIAGPFASRAEAEQAQQRIHGSGLTGTQIVPTATR
jgi:general secretion pathway protein A